MSSQLERLARPFPDAAIRGPAQGKYGSYVPHHVVVQALLATVGPFDLEVGEVFYGNDNRIEGCLVTLKVEVDGRRVSVTEIGDCEQPGNWKTQGARMKDAISDGIKRCSARLGLGLHLWAQEDYFLYDALQKQSAAGERVGEHPTADAAGAGSPAAPATSRARVQTLVARATSLRADRVDVDAVQAEWHLPDIDKSDEKQLGLWSQMLSDLEAGLTAPFEVPA